MHVMILSEEEANRRLVFCNNLRDIVRNGPIGAVELAKRTNFSVGTIYSYMRGNVLPSDDKIEQLADALGVTRDDLFDETNAPWKFGSEE